MVAKSEPKYPICSSPPYRNQRYSGQENLQGSWHSTSQVTHNKSFQATATPPPEFKR